MFEKIYLRAAPYQDAGCEIDIRYVSSTDHLSVWADHNAAKCVAYIHYVPTPPYTKFLRSRRSNVSSALADASLI